MSYWEKLSRILVLMSFCRTSSMDSKLCPDDESLSTFSIVRLSPLIRQVDSRYMVIQSTLLLHEFIMFLQVLQLNVWKIYLSLSFYLDPKIRR